MRIDCEQCSAAFTIDDGLASIMNSEQHEVVKLAKLAARLEHVQAQSYSA